MPPDGATAGNVQTALPHSCEMARRNASIIVFGSNPWNDYLQTRQHIARGLAARGWPVTYSTGMHIIWNRMNPDWRAANWQSALGEIDGVLLDHPGRWLMRMPRIALWDDFVFRRHVKNLMRISRWSEAQRRIAFVFHPWFEPYIDRLGDSAVVYYADDSFSKMPGTSSMVGALERSLVERADLIVATSAGVARALPGSGASRARILPNGADIEVFLRDSAGPCPPELENIPRPRIGYCGTINVKVDLGLIAALAAHRPAWSWVFIGELMPDAINASPALAAAKSILDGLPNVHFLGPKPYADLPRFQGHMDVNAMFYRTERGGWWEDISPLKLYEYLAVGKPIVASDLESLRPLHEIFAIAGSVQEWLVAIEAALLESGPEPCIRRRSAAQGHGWHAIVSRLEQWIVECCLGPTSPAARRSG